MTTDTLQDSSDHASTDVQTTAAETKDIETESAIADGNNIDSAEGLPIVSADESNDADR